MESGITLDEVVAYLAELAPAGAPVAADPVATGGRDQLRPRLVVQAAAAIRAVPVPRARSFDKFVSEAKERRDMYLRYEEAMEWCRLHGKGGHAAAGTGRWPGITGSGVNNRFRWCDHQS